MKKTCYGVLAFLLAGCLMILAPISASAESASTYTYTPAVNEGWVRTQDAYQVTEVILQEVSLNLAQDIIVQDDVLYIADTGNGKVVLYDLKTSEVKEWGVGVLTSPSGLFLTDDKELYVADNEAGKIVVFNKDGELVYSLEFLYEDAYKLHVYDDRIYLMTDDTKIDIYDFDKKLLDSFDVSDKVY